MIGSVAQSKLKLKGIAFGGTNERISVGDFAEYQFERTNAFSIQCWARWTSVDFGLFLGKTNQNTAGSRFRGYDMYKLGDGRVGFNINSDFVVAGNYLSKFTTTTFTDGRWHHFCATYDGSSTAAGARIYADGVQQPTTTERDSLSATILNNDPLVFGMQSGAVAGFYTGDMLDWAVWNKELTDSEVLVHFASNCPPRLQAVGAFANLKGFWRPQLSDSFPTLADLGSGAHDGTMTNMEAADIFGR